MQVQSFESLPQHYQALLRAASEAMGNAYSPYSKVRVGAALLGVDGSVVCGTNIENASYGLSICAERIALGTANTQGVRQFDAVAVVASGEGFAPSGIISPCGACRQMLFEASQASGRDIAVILSNADGSAVIVTSVHALLPLAMGGDGFAIQIGE